MSCQTSAERQARYLNALEARMRVLERYTAQLQQLADCSNTYDVWSPNPPYYDEPVPVGTDRWVGTIPRPFAASHIRLSCAYNTGADLTWGLEVGSDGLVLASGTWEYSEGVYSILIPFADWNTEMLSNILPAGAQVNLSTEVSSSTMQGLQIEFLGRWNQ